MKNELFLSALVLTPAVISTVTYTQSSEYKDYLSTVPARYKHPTKGFILGKILFSIKPEKFTPNNLNLIHSSYTGYLMFESDDGKTFYDLSAGEDGSILLHLANVDKQKKSATYTIFGCSSTNNCYAQPDTAEITQDGQITLNLNLSPDSPIEIYYGIFNGQEVWGHNADFKMILKK